MNSLIKIITLLLIIGCQNNDNEFLSLEENLYQKFEISCDRDTILESRQGVKIIIEANTFICSTDKKIELKFAAIIDKSDMISNRFYSINENGEFLETGGMFQIKDITNKTESFKKSIKFEISTSIANPKMSKYSSKKVKDFLVWLKTETSIKMSNDKNLINGKKLFIKSCSNCHSLNLRNDLTGPALGNVNLFRDKDWLIRFTKNSSQMISEGDTIANCLYQKWNKSLMTSFPEILEKEVEDIYEFIANESRLQGIGKNEIDYLSECEILDDVAINIRFDSEYKYLLEITDRNWVNVDYLAFVDSEIDPIILNLNQEYENLVIALAFQERNIVIPFVEDKIDSKKYSLWHPRKKDKIDFPLGEKVNIVAYDNSADFKFTIMEFQPKKKNNNIEFSLESKEKKEFLNRLKILNSQ